MVVVVVVMVVALLLLVVVPVVAAVVIIIIHKILVFMTILNFCCDLNMFMLWGEAPPKNYAIRHNEVEKRKINHG
jgi:hypothetical protein